MPRCRFLFAAELGDPISCIYLSDVGCMAGTMHGKVWLFDFDTKQVEMCTAFSDEGIRGLYCDADVAIATLTEGCRGWKRPSPLTSMATTSFRSLDKRNTQSVKHVLQRGPWACVLFPISSTVVNVARQEHHHRAFQLFDFGSSAEVVPCDFDGESLVVVDRTQGGSRPVFRLIQLERNEQVGIEHLQHGSHVTLAKLWGSYCLAYVAGGSTVYLYDYQKKQLARKLVGHRAEVIAMDATDPVSIATLSTDGAVKLWTGATGECKATVYIPEASFFLGFPYFLSVQGPRVLISADEGVFLMEFDVN